MNKQALGFLDRLAERFAAVIAGMVSSRVEGMTAVAQAEQQSQLEDLARQYEAEGKPEIAESLRNRAARLTSCNLASEGLEVMQQLSRPASLLIEHSNSVAENSDSGLPGLPRFDSPRPGRKRRVTEPTPDSSFPSPEAGT